MENIQPAADETQLADHHQNDDQLIDELYQDHLDLESGGNW